MSLSKKCDPPDLSVRTRRAMQGLLAGLFVVWACLAGPGSPNAADDDHDADFLARIDRLIETDLRRWLDDPILLSAVREHNDRHAAITQREIDRLDKQWRAEARKPDRPLIDGVMARSSSHHLKSLRSMAGGLLTEVILMDRKGLNVGLSDVTSDYWQGDEAKWQRPLRDGPGTRFVDRVDWDESTQQFQCQVSLPVVADSAVIGARRSVSMSTC